MRGGERIFQLAILIQEIVHVLTDVDSLHDMMENIPGCTCFGLVFVPNKNMSSYIGNVFGWTSEMQYAGTNEF